MKYEKIIFTIILNRCYTEIVRNNKCIFKLELLSSSYNGSRSLITKIEKTYHKLFVESSHLDMGVCP